VAAMDQTSEPVVLVPVRHEVGIKTEDGKRTHRRTSQKVSF